MENMARELKKQANEHKNLIFRPKQRKCSKVKFDQSVRDITLKAPLNFLRSLLHCTDPLYDAGWQMFLSNSVREQRKANKKSYWPRRTKIISIHLFNCGKWQ